MQKGKKKKKKKKRHCVLSAYFQLLYCDLILDWLNHEVKS